MLLPVSHKGSKSNLHHLRKKSLTHRVKKEYQYCFRETGYRNFVSASHGHGRNFILVKRILKNAEVFSYLYCDSIHPFQGNGPLDHATIRIRIKLGTVVVVGEERGNWFSGVKPDWRQIYFECRKEYGVTF